MNRKTNTALIALLGTILLGLSTWVLISIIEIKSQISFIQSELVNLDKTIGRIFYWFEKFTNK